ncbi:BA14K family protein [Roseibium polysiphoniae]|uniref:BA14K family protein n=1 Tax=Roseibium polysiphoniae TaxID=2571221 RepID=UPI00329709E6
MLSLKFISSASLAAAAFSLSLSLPAEAGSYGYSGHSTTYSGHTDHKPRAQYRYSYRGSNKHLGWCFNRYRSYRKTDNTFQPYHGSRKACISPFVQERLELFADEVVNNPEDIFRQQSGIDAGAAVRDELGNLPETQSAGQSTANEDAPGEDEFGNLPEQAAAVSRSLDAATPSTPQAVQSPIAGAAPPAQPQAPAETAAANATAPEASPEAQDTQPEQADQTKLATDQAPSEEVQVEAAPTPEPEANSERGERENAQQGSAQ